MCPGLSLRGLRKHTRSLPFSAPLPPLPAMDENSQQDVMIIDKDESSDSAYHVVDGFIIEDSKSPFPNGRLSFVPEEYGKEKPPPIKRPRNHTTTTNTTSTPSASAAPPEDLPPGMLKCEHCGMVAERDQFLPPSRRFCSLTCCKRYSAERRYYPYGKDEEGIAQSIREGLLHPRSARHLRPKQAQNLRDQRRGRGPFYGGNPGREREMGERGPRRSSRGRRGRRGRPSNSPIQARGSDRHSLHMNIVEPYTHPCGTPLQSWSVEDVGEFLTALGYEAYVDKFLEHEIDGKALSLVQDHHLLMTMKLRLGPTLKIIEHVNAIKTVEEIGEEI